MGKSYWDNTVVKSKRNIIVTSMRTYSCHEETSSQHGCTNSPHPKSKQTNKIFVKLLKQSWCYNRFILELNCRLKPCKSIEIFRLLPQTNTIRDRACRICFRSTLPPPPPPPTHTHPTRPPIPILCSPSDAPSFQNSRNRQQTFHGWFPCFCLRSLHME